MEWRMAAPDQAAAVARAVLQALPDRRVFALHGVLGAGKTTLVKAFCQQLGVTDRTSSPSFALVNEYRTGTGDRVYHLDLYRLRDPGELEAIGFTEYVDSGHYCFIEWPELAGGLLPADAVHLFLEVLADGGRRIGVRHGA
jgi:tRNA threonylcarbamoyladenosine biosynthesis protein TsaE